MSLRYGDLCIDQLPRPLFRSDTEYFLLWFLVNGGEGKFYRAGKSLERWKGRPKNTLMGYTTGHYRAYNERPEWRRMYALWWKPWNPDPSRRPGSFPAKRPDRRNDDPFRLTQRGRRRALLIFDRVRSFLETLTEDLTLE